MDKPLLELLGKTDISLVETTDVIDTIAQHGNAFLAKAEGKAGGTGKKFNWDLIAKAKIEKPFFLSGGIGTADAAAIKAFKHPDFFGIDINSLFEKEPGVKDMALLLQFLQSLK